MVIDIGHQGYLGYLGCLHHDYQASNFTFVSTVTLATKVVFVTTVAIFTLADMTCCATPLIGETPLG
jgi:hypothetical protein